MAFLHTFRPAGAASWGKMTFLYTYRPAGAAVIGQGIIKNRLRAHRNNPDILQYRTQTSPLYVAWAEVPWIHRTGVEMYLHEELNPLVGEPPQGTPIPIRVNLPSYE